ncbi:hypothetical protein ACOMHN_040183 [Nucella lapillus]
MDQAYPSCDADIVQISLPWPWRPVKRRMLPGCEFFREGDVAMRIARKLIPLEDEDDDDDCKDDNERAVKDTIPCSILGCMQTFTSLLSYENHYKSAHGHTCVTCHRTFPSAYLLDIHIQENHDPLFAILAERQPMFRCLVESCGDQFSAPDARRQHMVKAHSYPANFRFHRLRATQPPHRKKPPHSDKATSEMDIDRPPPNQRSSEKASGKTGASSSLASSHIGVSPAQCPPSDKESSVTGSGATPGADGKEEEEGMEVLDTEKPVARRVFVHKVPQNFSFGHGVSRGFQRPPGGKQTSKKKKKGGHWHQQGADNSGQTTVTNIENVDMLEMAEALGDAL